MRRDSTKKRIPAARKATQILLENFSSARTTKGVEQSDDEEGGKAGPQADSLHGKSLWRKWWAFLCPLEGNCMRLQGKECEKFLEEQGEI